MESDVLLEWTDYNRTHLVYSQAIKPVSDARSWSLAAHHARARWSASTSRLTPLGWYWPLSACVICHQGSTTHGRMALYCWHGGLELWWWIDWEYGYVLRCATVSWQTCDHFQRSDFSAATLVFTLLSMGFNLWLTWKYYLCVSLLLWYINKVNNFVQMN